jgi:hypothetical protein
MQEDDSLYNAMIIALIIGIIIVIATLIFMRPPPEYFSELYYTNHTMLPRFVTPGLEQAFDFTIANHENGTRTYDIFIFAEHENSTTPIKSFTAEVGKEERRDFRVIYTLPEYTKAKVQTGFGDQEIHFFVYNPERAMQYPEGIASLSCVHEVEAERGEFIITARGTYGPMMKVRVDGKEVMNATVPDTETEYRIDAVPERTIDIVFDNDIFNQTAGIDRNLYIKSVQMGNTTVSTFTFDGQTGIRAFDCMMLRNSTNAATSNGALRMRII